MNKPLHFKTHYFFPTPSRYLGYIITIIGIIGVFTRGIEVLFICPIGIGLSFTRSGVLVDKENSRLKEYTNIFGFKNGKWKLLTLYPYITVLTITEKAQYIVTQMLSFSSKQMVYRITLLNENHYEKILLRQLNDKDLAHAEAKRIATELGVEKVIYSPR